MVTTKQMKEAVENLKKISQVATEMMITMKNMHYDSISIGKKQRSLGK